MDGNCFLFAFIPLILITYVMETLLMDGGINVLRSVCEVFGTIMTLVSSFKYITICSFLFITWSFVLMVKFAESVMLNSTKIVVN